MNRFTSNGLVVLVLLLSTSAKAQHQELSEKAVMYKGKQNTTSDTTSILHAFKAGSFHGQIGRAHV